MSLPQHIFGYTDVRAMLEWVGAINLLISTPQHAFGLERVEAILLRMSIPQHAFDWLLRRACHAGVGWGNTLTDVYTATRFWYGVGWGNTLTDVYSATRFWYGVGWGNTLTDLYTTTRFWLVRRACRARSGLGQYTY